MDNCTRKIIAVCCLLSPLFMCMRLVWAWLALLARLMLKPVQRLLIMVVTNAMITLAAVPVSALSIAGEKNVEPELLDVNDSTASVVAGGYASQSTTGTTINTSAGIGTLNHAVHYYATGVAIIGAVTSSVMYSIIYL